MGSNMAEAHPVGFQWVMEAKANDATVIHIDPRFTRTSALSDLHVPLRGGTDIAFLGGVINYILSHELDFRGYVLPYTNASFLVSENYQDTEDLDGLFSGYDEAKAAYDPATWLYEGTSGSASAGTGHHGEAKETSTPYQHGSGGPVVEGATEGIVVDPTLRHPRCVYQILKRHFARYTPEMVEAICGIPKERFLRICTAWTSNSGRDRTAALVYSVGWTQHSVGAQFIRAGSIIQLLLGNIGRPGGGIFALRGHASIQGSTDIPTLFNLLPGYLPMPTPAHSSLAAYIESIRGDKQKGFWRNADTYVVSLLKEYWGDAATKDNDFCFGYLPRINGDHGTYRTVMDMVDGKVFGYFLLGQNPAVGSAHGKLQRLGMANLDWLVVRDLTMIESATFWKDAPEIETGEIVPQQCRTEVFFFPAAAHVEKEGTFTQTQRMLQWREKAVEPAGDQRSELWFFYHLGRRIKQRLAASADERDRPLLDLAWDYEVHADEPSAEVVLRHINGHDLTTGQVVNGYLDLKADGTTSCGCWIYSGVYADGVNQAARRKSRFKQDLYAAEWGWVWPLNRRVLYNRASADADGKPWSDRKALVWWDAERGEWTGHDVPDFPKDKPPTYLPPQGAVGPDALHGDDPFIMQSDGKGWLFAPTGLADGPLPTHYGPHESPVRNLLYGQQGNPTRKVYGRSDNPSQPVAAGAAQRGFPVCVHYRAPHRAPYCGRDEPDAAVPVGVAAGAVRRGLTGAGGAARAPAPRLGACDHQSRGRRGASGRHRPDGTAARAGPGRAPDLDALSLGRLRPRAGRCRGTTCSGWSSTRTCSSRRARSPPATSSLAAGRAGQSCCPTSPIIARRAEITIATGTQLATMGPAGITHTEPGRQSTEDSP